MKIAFVSQPFAQVGREREDSITIWTHRVLEASNLRLDDVIIYCRALPDFPPIERRNRIEYRRIPADREERLQKIVRTIERLLRHPWPRRPFFASMLNYLGYGVRVAWDLRKQNRDIVHIHNSTQFVPIIRAFNPHIKIVLHMHCEWLSQLDARTVERRLEQTDLVIGCSKHVVEKVVARFPHFSDRCCVVSNGVDLERFGVSTATITDQSDAPMRLLFVGRVSPEKGVHVLLRAVERVIAQVPDIQVDVIGGLGSAPFEYMVLISEEKTVRDLAAFYRGWRHRSDYPEALLRQLPPDLAGRVNFTGELPHNEVADYYHRAHVLVNPSLSEAFGLSLVEAMASKIPVIATNVGGMKEVVEHGRTGLLVEPADPDALAEALIRLLKDDDLRRSMGAAGYRRAAELYTWNRVSQCLWEKYVEIMDHAKATCSSLPSAQPIAESPLRDNAQ